MKVAILTQNKKIEIKNINIPQIKEDECLIKIKNVGICSSDIQRGFGGGAYFYPLIMGHEMSGEVSKIGENVEGFDIGDKVGIFPLLPCFKCDFCKQKKYVRCKSYSYYGSRTNGGYAQYLNIKSWNLIKIDQKLNFKDIACLEPMSVALHCLKRVGLYENNINNLSIVIIGAGFLGLLAAQILKIKFPNHKLTVIDRNDFKLNIAKKYSDQTFLLDTKESWKNFLDDENRNNFDIAIEATGVPESFINSIELTKEGGKCLWMGNITNDLSIDKKIISSILRKEIKIIGTWNSDYDPDAKTDDWRESIDLIKNYNVSPSQLITHYINLDEIPSYITKLYKHKNREKEFKSIKVMMQ